MKYGRVVLADNHLNMLGGVYSLLAAWFEAVLMVADEPSLLDAIAHVKPCLVVVDLSLPDSGEVHIARRLMEAYPSLCLLVLSVHDDPTVVSQVCRVGVAGFVLKRTVATDLVPAIQEVLRGGTYLSPSLQGDRCPASKLSLPGASDKQ